MAVTLWTLTSLMQARMVWLVLHQVLQVLPMVRSAPRLGALVAREADPRAQAQAVVEPLKEPAQTHPLNR